MTSWVLVHSLQFEHVQPFPYCLQSLSCLSDTQIADIAYHSQEFILDWSLKKPSTQTKLDFRCKQMPLGKDWKL